MRAGLFVALSVIPVADADAQLRVRSRSGTEALVSQLRLDDDRLRGTVAGANWSLPLRDLWTVTPLRPGTAAAPNARIGASFVRLRRAGRPALELAAAFVGARAGSQGESILRFDLHFGGESEVPLRHVQAIRFAKKDLAATPSEDDGGKNEASKSDATKKPATPASRAVQKVPSDEGFLAACAAPPRNRDLLFVQVKDKLRRVPCKIKTIDSKSVTVERGSVPIEQVYGLVLGEISGVEPAPVPSPQRILLRLRDRRELSGRLESISTEAVALVVDAGLSMRVGWSAIVDLELESERLVYLSSLALAEGSRAPAALGRSWPLLRDMAPGGGSLSLDGRRYRRGFFAVPPRRLIFDLPRKFDRLEGEVGMLESRFGSATLRFFDGDRPLGNAIELTADGRAHPIRIELRSATRLRIELEVGPELDSGSRVILGDLRVVAD